MAQIITSCIMLFGVIIILIIKASFTDAEDLRLACDYLDSIDISGGDLFDNNTIYHKGVYYQPAHYGWIDYRLDKRGDAKWVNPYPRGCICQVRLCVPLCCDPQFIAYEERLVSCKNFNNTLELWVNEVNNTGNVEVVNYMRKYQPVKVVRVASSSMIAADHYEWYTNPNGSVIIMDSFRKWYCLQPSLEQRRVSTLYFSNNTRKIPWKAIALSVSLPFLVATLLIYACIPELRNIHGKSLICHVLALTFLYILVTLHFSFDKKIIPCNVLVVLVYFLVLVSFFWLNVMCFDIYWTFRSESLLALKNEPKRFLFYSMYAWGFPLLMLTLALLNEQTDLITKHSGPKFWQTCDLSHGIMTVYPFLLLPLFLLLAFNLYFFVVTVVRIVRVQKAIDAVLINAQSDRHCRLNNNRYPLSLYLRLFCVMCVAGCIWPLQTIAWAAKQTSWFMYLSEACNCLLGMIVFFLFVWNQKVRKLVACRIRRCFEQS